MVSQKCAVFIGPPCMESCILLLYRNFVLNAFRGNMFDEKLSFEMSFVNIVCRLYFVIIVYCFFSVCMDYIYWFLSHEIRLLDGGLRCIQC